MDWRWDYYGAVRTDGSSSTSSTSPTDWPSGLLSAYGWELGALAATYTSWYGSLLRGRKDANGLVYLRNRSYDTTTGQFTQQDPIGLAGGLNLYGYADGDPINFSDPFGLCPGAKGSGTICLAFYIANETALFGALKGDGRGPSSSSNPARSRAYAIIDPANPEGARVQVNGSCWAGGGGCKPASGSNSFTVASDGNGGFTVNVDLVNSLVPGPHINASIHFTPDGDGGWQASGTRDGFPSVEAYYYRKNGTTQEVINQGEGKERQLWGKADRKIP